MSAITNLYQQTTLAEAAYADFWDQENNGLIPESQMEGELTTEGMSPKQASVLLDTWDILDHVPNLDSGFSATIFRSRSDPGHYTLDKRGQCRIDF